MRAQEWVCLGLSAGILILAPFGWCSQGLLPPGLNVTRYVKIATPSRDIVQLTQKPYCPKHASPLAWLAHPWAPAAGSSPPSTTPTLIRQRRPCAAQFTPDAFGHAFGRQGVPCRLGFIRSNRMPTSPDDRWSTPISDEGVVADAAFEQRVADLGSQLQFHPSGNHTEWVMDMKREHDDYCASLSGGQLVKMELIRSVLLRVSSSTSCTALLHASFQPPNTACALVPSFSPHVCTDLTTRGAASSESLTSQACTCVCTPDGLEEKSTPAYTLETSDITPRLLTRDEPQETCPRVLLLDETFAPLDPFSKRLVQTRLRASCVNSIVLVIYHRDSEATMDEEGGGGSGGGGRAAAETDGGNVTGHERKRADVLEESVPCVPPQVLRRSTMPPLLFFVASWWRACPVRLVRNLPSAMPTIDIHAFLLTTNRHFSPRASIFSATGRCLSRRYVIADLASPTGGGEWDRSPSRK